MLRVFFLCQKIWKIIKLCKTVNLPLVDILHHHVINWSFRLKKWFFSYLFDFVTSPTMQKMKGICEGITLVGCSFSYLISFNTCINHVVSVTWSHSIHVLTITCKIESCFHKINLEREWRTLCVHVDFNLVHFDVSLCWLPPSSC